MLQPLSHWQRALEAASLGGNTSVDSASEPSVLMPLQQKIPRGIFLGHCLLNFLALTLRVKADISKNLFPQPKNLTVASDFFSLFDFS